MAAKKPIPAPAPAQAVPAAPAAHTPLVDEIAAISARIMDRIEHQTDQELEKNLVWTILRSFGVLHSLSAMTLGAADADVLLLGDMLMKNNEALTQEIINNRDALQARFAAGASIF